ncbi:MAG: peptidoglycan glycosyltransferase [Lachnospiraceae bacterium]|nr:peptidoglycan glycosyltransferase [Lachnospiraceae bacterium]
MVLACLWLSGRLAWLMIFQSEYYMEQADELHERERSIKAARGEIYDATGTVIAANRTVCTISVIHNQITDADQVVEVLSEQLQIDPEKVRASVEKYSAREVIKTNVDKETGDAIRAFHLDGVKVDEDYKRYYPFGELASRVLGFTGSDNQGIIGLEVKYESVLKGIDGKILTMTTAAGIELDSMAEERIEPVPGNNLILSLDMNIQKYAQQAAEKVMEEKGAIAVNVVIMNPQNGEILAMVSVPEFDLNNPFTLNYELDQPVTAQEKQDLLNKMWRNPCISDTYEPGSTFKIVTATAALEEGVVSVNDSFHCPGYKMVEDRRIRCHKTTGHGSETFVQGVMNSCNPVFIEVGLRVGAERFYSYFDKFGLMRKTGVDIPGEASGIMHQPEDIGEVELATMSFGQSFQITPLQLLTVASMVVNGGTRVTPHFGVAVQSADGSFIQELEYPVEEHVISEQTCETMKMILEKVVSEGGGKNAFIEGYRIGGKTATSEKLPRSLKKYISSFLGFAPADDPQVIALITINEPEGIYYGGTIAAPVIRDIFENILPYLGLYPEYSPEG